MKKVNEQYIIGSLIGQFNFEQVEQFMIDNNWTWSDGKVPNQEQMKDVCRDLISDLLKDKKLDSTGTGGFCAYRSDECIALRFEIGDVFEEEK